MMFHIDANPLAEGQREKFCNVPPFPTLPRLEVGASTGSTIPASGLHVAPSFEHCSAAQEMPAGTVLSSFCSAETAQKEGDTLA